MLDVTHKQIKKWSLFKFSFLTSIPFGLALMLYSMFMVQIDFGFFELIGFSMSGLFIAFILAGFMTLCSWFIGLIRPDAVAFRVDQNTVKLGEVFR